MKKTMLLMVLAGSLALASCKKGWACQCTDDRERNNYYDIPNSTLQDAVHTCNGYKYHTDLAFNNCPVIN